MPFSPRVALFAFLGLCVTIILPIVAAIFAATRQAQEAESRFALGLANTALMRSEMTGQQLARVDAALRGFDTATACSDAGLDLMRQLDLSSTMLQGIAWIEDDRIVCSSFGGRRSYALGGANHTSALGAIFRSNVSLDASGESYLVVQSGASAAIIHKDLALSFVEDIPGSAVTVFSWSQRIPILRRGEVPAALLKRSYVGDTILRDGATTIAVVKSDRYDLGAIAVFPAAHYAGFARKTAWLTIPVGLACAWLLSALFLKLLRTRSSLRGMIRAALAAGEFNLAYQPLIDLETQEVIGVEALLRWDRGSRLAIAPDVFIPVAEQAGLMGQLTDRVLDILGRDAHAILELAPDAHLAVNFSATELTDGDLAATLARWSAHTGVPLNCFIAEATERALIDVDKAAGQFPRLREAGVRIAIDDFGTGYANLAYLTALEVDYLKIDRLFVQAMGTSAATDQVAASIVAMASQLGLRTIAEGVETEAQARQVRALGCDHAQGYYFARPMPLGELCEWLRARTLPERMGRVNHPTTVGTALGSRRNRSLATQKQIKRAQRR